MGGRNTVLLFASLGLVLAMAGPAAAQSQENVAEIEGQLIDVPDELPGTYQAALAVVVQNAGGACACSQTTIQLEIVDDGAADQAVLSPASFQIDWSQAWRDGHPGEAHKDVRLSFHVPEEAAGSGMSKIVIGGTGHTDSPAAHVEVLETQIAIPLPSEEASSVEADEDREEESNASTTEEPGTSSDASSLGASTHEAGATQAGPSGSLGPIAAGFVASAAAGVVLVRRRRSG